MRWLVSQLKHRKKTGDFPFVRDARFLAASSKYVSILFQLIVQLTGSSTPVKQRLYVCEKEK